MKKLTVIILTVLLLQSCQMHNMSKPLVSSLENASKPAKVTKQSPLIPSPIVNPPLKLNPIVNTPLKLNPIDWDTSFLPIVKEILSVQEINHGSVLLVNTLKNNTNGKLSTNQATAVLTRLMSNNGGKLQKVTIEQVNAARKKLGMFTDDSLESLSKALGLARSLNAQHVLYSTANGNVKAPLINLKLICVKTG